MNSQCILSKDGQLDAHMNSVEGINVREKKKLTFTSKFVDKYTGECLGTDPDIAFMNLSFERRSALKALMLEIKTGKPHKAM